MSDPKKLSPARAALFRTILVVVSLGLTLVFAELFVRVAVPQSPSWLAIYREHPALPFYSMLPETRFHVDTGETKWTIETDANGFRFDPDLKKDTACTLLWLGDSYGFGHGLPYPESFIGQIDHRLPRVRVLNASVSGYGPRQYRQTLEYLIGEGIEFDHLIVATYVGNDFHDTKWVKSRSVSDGIIGNRRDLKSLLMRNLHLYRLAASVYHRIGPPRPDSYAKVVAQLASAEAWEEPFLADARAIYEREMARIVELAEAHDADVVFVVLPTRQAVAATLGEEPEGAITGDPMLPVERATEILHRIGAREIDMTPVIAKHPTDQAFFKFDGHLTALASMDVAAAILDTVSLDCPEARAAR